MDELSPLNEAIEIADFAERMETNKADRKIAQRVNKFCIEYAASFDIEIGEPTSRERALILAISARENKPNYRAMVREIKKIEDEAARLLYPAPMITRAEAEWLIRCYDFQIEWLHEKRKHEDKKNKEDFIVGFCENESFRSDTLDRYLRSLKQVWSPFAADIWRDIKKRLSGADPEQLMEARNYIAHLKDQI